MAQASWTLFLLRLLLPYCRPPGKQSLRLRGGAHIATYQHALQADSCGGGCRLDRHGGCTAGSHFVGSGGRSRDSDRRALLTGYRRALPTDCCGGGRHDGGHADAVGSVYRVGCSGLHASAGLTAVAAVARHSRRMEKGRGPHDVEASPMRGREPPSPSLPEQHFSFAPGYTCSAPSVWTELPVTGKSSSILFFGLLVDVLPVRGVSRPRCHVGLPV